MPKFRNNSCPAVTIYRRGEDKILYHGNIGYDSVFENEYRKCPVRMIGVRDMGDATITLSHLLTSYNQDVSYHIWFHRPYEVNKAWAELVWERLDGFLSLPHGFDTGDDILYGVAIKSPPQTLNEAKVWGWVMDVYWSVLALRDSQRVRMDYLSWMSHTEQAFNSLALGASEIKEWVSAQSRAYDQDSHWMLKKS